MKLETHNLSVFSLLLPSVAEKQARLCRNTYFWLPYCLVMTLILGIS